MKSMESVFDLEMQKKCKDLHEKYGISIDPSNILLFDAASRVLPYLFTENKSNLPFERLKDLSTLMDTNQPCCAILRLNHPDKVKDAPEVASRALTQYLATQTSPRHPMHQARCDMIQKALNEIKFVYNEESLKNIYGIVISYDPKEPDTWGLTKAIMPDCCSILNELNKGNFIKVNTAQSAQLMRQGQLWIKLLKYDTERSVIMNSNQAANAIELFDAYYSEHQTFASKEQLLEADNALTRHYIRVRDTLIKHFPQYTAFVNAPFSPNKRYKLDVNMLDKINNFCPSDDHFIKQMESYFNIRNQRIEFHHLLNPKCTAGIRYNQIVSNRADASVTMEATQSTQLMQAAVHLYNEYGISVSHSQGIDVIIAAYTVVPSLLSSENPAPLSPEEIRHLQTLAQANVNWYYLLAFNHPDKVKASPMDAIEALNKYVYPTHPMLQARWKMITATLDEMKYVYNEQSLKDVYGIIIFRNSHDAAKNQSDDKLITLCCLTLNQLLKNNTLHVPAMTFMQAGQAWARILEYNSEQKIMKGKLHAAKAIDLFDSYCTERNIFTSKEQLLKADNVLTQRYVMIRNTLLNLCPEYKEFLNAPLAVKRRYPIQKDLLDVMNAKSVNDNDLFVELIEDHFKRYNHRVEFYHLLNPTCAAGIRYNQIKQATGPAATRPVMEGNYHLWKPKPSDALIMTSEKIKNTL